jgi:hypothetical protein
MKKKHKRINCILFFSLYVIVFFLCFFLTVKQNSNTKLKNDKKFIHFMKNLRRK